MCSKVVITNLEAGTTIDLDARKWPDAQADDVSAFYKVTLGLKLSIYISIFKRIVLILLEYPLWLLWPSVLLFMLVLVIFGFIRWEHLALIGELVPRPVVCFVQMDQFNVAYNLMLFILWT